MTGIETPEALKSTRRGFLRGALGLAAGAALGGGLAGKAEAAVQAFDPEARARLLAPRSLKLLNVNTGERFESVYYQGGFYEPEAMESLDKLLRDHHEDAVLIMDVRLYDFLAEIQSAIGGKAIQITSGYRTPRTNARLSGVNERVAMNSLHMRGMAVDLKTPGVKISDVRAIAREIARKQTRGAADYGGVGSYAGASFLHVDVGDLREWRS